MLNNKPLKYISICLNAFGLENLENHTLQLPFFHWFNVSCYGFTLYKVFRPHNADINQCRAIFPCLFPCPYFNPFLKMEHSAYDIHNKVKHMLYVLVLKIFKSDYFSMDYIIPSS